MKSKKNGKQQVCSRIQFCQQFGKAVYHRMTVGPHGTHFILFVLADYSLAFKFFESYEMFTNSKICMIPTSDSIPRSLIEFLLTLTLGPAIGRFFSSQPIHLCLFSVSLPRGIIASQLFNCPHEEQWIRHD
jgi:hypothetical protein